MMARAGGGQHNSIFGYSRWRDALPARLRLPIAALLFAATCAYAFWPLQAPVRPWNDFSFIYAAGRSWLTGFSPYDFERWNAEWIAVYPEGAHVAQPMPFMYLPNWAPIAMALGVLPWAVASRLWDVLNVATYFALCALLIDLLADDFVDSLKKPSVWLFLGFATFNPALRHTLWQSQMTLLPTLGVVGAFWAQHQSKTAWLAIFGFLAALKPQLAFLPLLYLFLNGGHLGLLWGAAASLGVGFMAMVPTHLERLPGDVARSYAMHMQLDFNAPAKFLSLPSLAAGLVSGNQFMKLSLLLAVVAVTALSIAKRRHKPTRDLLSHPLWQLGIVSAATAMLMPVHGYDLVIYTPLFFLAYELRTGLLAWLIMLFVWFAGRPLFIGKVVPFLSQPGPYLTFAIALALFAAAASLAKTRYHVAEGID